MKFLTIYGVEYEIATAEKQTVKPHKFPPDDLLNDLIEIHFRNTHCTMPILYEPKFRQSVREGLHYRDPHFGGLVMMICALSSRDSNDPRVFLPGQQAYSAGWKYYEQVQIVRKSMFEPPNLHELQMYCVSAYCANQLRNSLRYILFSLARSQICHGHLCTAEWMGSSYPWDPALPWARYTSKTTTRISGHSRRWGKKASILVNLSPEQPL